MVGNLSVVESPVNMKPLMNGVSEKQGKGQPLVSVRLGAKEALQPMELSELG